MFSVNFKFKFTAETKSKFADNMTLLHKANIFISSVSVTLGPGQFINEGPLW